MDDKKDKFPEDKGADETVNSLIEIMEEIVDADTIGKTESKTDSENSRLTSHQNSEEYCAENENSKESEETVLPIQRGYKEIPDGPSSSNLDASLQVSTERSAKGSNPVLTGNTNAKLSTSFEIESSENTLSDHQEIKKAYEEDSSKPKEEIVSNMSLIIKNTIRTPHANSPSPSSSSRIISVRSPSSRMNSNVSISDELPDFSRMSTVPGIALPLFTPTISTSENLNSFLQNSTTQATSVAPPLHLRNVSAHNIPHLEPSRTGSFKDRTSSHTCPQNSRNFSDVTSVNQPTCFPPCHCFSCGFAYGHLFPQNCSLCGGAPTHPVFHPFNYGMCPHSFPPISNQLLSQHGYNAPSPTIEQSSSISSTATNFTTPNTLSQNTLTSTCCLAPSRTSRQSSGPVFTSANLSTLVAPTPVSSMPVSSGNELSVSGANSSFDNSKNSKQSLQESISAAMLLEVRTFFANNPISHPERMGQIDNSMNLRNSDGKGPIPPSQTEKNSQISQRVSTPKRAREEAGCPSSRSSVYSRSLSSRSSRSSSISTDCSSQRSSLMSINFRDDKYELLEACEQLAKAGISESDFRLYARNMLEGTPEDLENLDIGLRRRILSVSAKLGQFHLCRLYDQLNKPKARRSAYDRRLNEELSKILKNPRTVSDGSPPKKSPKFSVQSQGQWTSSDEFTLGDLYLSTSLAPIFSENNSDVLLRIVERSEISEMVDITPNQTASTNSSVASRLNPQSINNRLIGSSDMQSNESFDSLDPVPNQQVPEQSGSIDDANTEAMQSNESQATFDNGSEIAIDNESENEVGKFGSLPCNVM